MPDLLLIGGGLVLGVALGAAVASWMVLGRLWRSRSELTDARTRVELLQKQVDERDRDLADLQQRFDDANDVRERVERERATLVEQVNARQQQIDDQRAQFAQTRLQLRDEFAALSASALRANNEQFNEIAKRTFETLIVQARGDVAKKHQAIEELVNPMREMLDRHQKAVTAIEGKREVAYRGLEEQIKSIADAHVRLGKETHRLVSALRRPSQRGQWGEMQLRNAVELAGMTAHCDFHEQPATDAHETRDRPDMTIRMPGGAVIIVDSKVALDAYLDAIQPDADRRACMERHAKQLAVHASHLARKEYWSQFERTPKLVVMFMPLESALSAAMEIRPELHPGAMRNHVLIATPTLLVALLRSIAYGWQQEDVAANAREISDVGNELYKRVGIFVEHLTNVGKSIDASAKAYNQAVGSLDTRLMPGARRLKSLNATSEAPIKAPQMIEVDVRESVTPVDAIEQLAADRLGAEG